MKHLNLEELTTLVESAGYPIYKVGGTVRDTLLGIEANDIDLVTSMPIEKLKSLCDLEGIGCVSALDNKDTKVVIISGFEVAEFRRDVYDEKGNFKEATTATIEDDALRRDFTINSLYERNGEILDFTNGRSDLENKILRTCGNPLQRFKEDSSRIVRAAYLAAKLDLTIADDLKDCVKANKHLLNHIKPALYGKMISKAIKANVFYKFLLRLEELDIVFDVFPEWKNQYLSPQNPKYHHLTVWEHTKEVVRNAEIRKPGNVIYILSALTHDIGKSLPEIRILRNGEPSDLGHEDFGAPIAKKFILRLELGKKYAEFAFLITKFHGLQMSLTSKSIIKSFKKIAPYFNNKNDFKNFIDELFSIMEDDASGFTPSFKEEKLSFIQELKLLTPEILESTMFFISDLPVDGSFVIKHSNLRNAEIGNFLSSLVQDNIKDIDTILKKLNKH